LWLIVPLLLLYVLFTRARRQQRLSVTVQESVRPGMRVMTTSGIYGVVIAIEEPAVVVLEIAPGVQTRWARQAIAQVKDDVSAPESSESTVEPVIDLSTDHPDGSDDRQIPESRS
jgi:preprotein translocase subunit YajC